MLALHLDGITLDRTAGTKHALKVTEKLLGIRDIVYNCDKFATRSLFNTQRETPLFCALYFPRRFLHLDVFAIVRNKNRNKTE
jgi:hypothetical protein